MFILHVNTENTLAEGWVPGCIPELLIEGDNHSSTAHVIINTDDSAKFEQIFKKIMERNPTLRAEACAGAIAVGYVPGTYQQNKIPYLDMVISNDYQFLVYVRHAAQNIEQELLDDGKVQALLGIHSFQE